MKFKKTIVGLAMGLGLCVSLLTPAFADDETTLVVMIRGLDNPYHANYAAGAHALGERLGLPVSVLSSEGNSQKQFADLRAQIARTGGNMVVNIDPNEGPDVVPIAKILEDAGVYWVNWWNKPDEVSPSSYPHWVAHITFDAEQQGYYNAIELFKTFETPNEGSVIAVQGMLSNNAAIGRFKGLQKALAENPGVELLQWEAADWDTNRAYEVTKQLLAAHPDVDGIWTANDNMAIGAIAALKETSDAGAVKVSGTDGIPDAFDAIIDGTLSSTEFMDSRYQSQLGLTMALAAKNGDLDPSTTPAEHRAFMISGTQVNADNVETFVEEVFNTMPEYDLTDYYAQWVSAAE
ncbi:MULTISPECIES: sugar ABC transporter substrate-binding protein [Pacificibacter]|uniref:sugar ABC transporter substrate-binding protein n=1 Tax=Pacificibacter TaxID=1042323 RepID=UPI001C09663A|nr:MULTISPECIES: sugar ABC transporter substrate-binding protein [Pacificibacter]MBU2937176.1 sugar ABC transporter substrate-binding protein [Pacificibacter marinus]MDO6617004.1 sugar ABC transporter substrate-binding protein [Pacificibacter sp. 1_MG-2023]